MKEIFVETTETVKTIIEWHEQTFPSATLYGQLQKFREETRGFHDTHNIDNLADMFIVACGMARFNYVLTMQYFGLIFQMLCLVGVKVGEFYLAVEGKMEKNRTE